MSHATSLDQSPKASATPADRLRDTITATLLFLATAAFTLWQNTRVAVLWDISYLLDSSFRISLGQFPYRDFPFAHAPITFLLHAAIIRIFGRVYFPHILCAALEAGLATVLTWRLLLNNLRVPHDRGANGDVIVGIVSAPRSNTPWFLATLLAAPLTVLGIYAIYPHPIYDSDCILAVLLTLYLLQRAAESLIRNAMAGAACLIPLFIKQNIGLPFLLITLFSVAAIATLRHLHRTTIAPQLAFLAGASATFAAALVILHATVGLHNYLYWTITFAAQRRLPGLSTILTIYHQTSLLWTIPTAIAGVILLRKGPGAPSMSQSHRDMGGMRRRLAFLLLAVPFLWTVAALALTTDADDRADQLLSLWPHLLLLAAALAICNLFKLRAAPTLNTLLPIILLATIHGAFLSQQLWGSTYAVWPLLMLLIAMMLMQIPRLTRPLAVTIAQPS